MLFSDNDQCWLIFSFLGRFGERIRIAHLLSISRFRQFAARSHPRATKLSSCRNQTFSSLTPKTSNFKLTSLGRWKCSAFSDGCDFSVPRGDDTLPRRLWSRILRPNPYFCQNNPSQRRMQHDDKSNHQKSRKPRKVLLAQPPKAVPDFTFGDSTNFRPFAF